MSKKIYGIIAVIIFSAILVLPTVVWYGMMIAGGDSFIETNIAAQLIEEEQRAPMKFSDVLKGKTNENGETEPFSLNDLGANIESLYNDYAPFRVKLINVKRDVTEALEKPYEEKIKPALIELWYSDEGNTAPGGETPDDLDNILDPGDDGDDVVVPGGETCAHEYVDVVTKPTCTEKGYTTHTCSKCDDVYTDSYVDAAGHSSDKWIIDKEATETEEGKRHKKCDVCKEEFATEVIPTLGHSFSKYVYNNDATCTKDGTETAPCDDHTNCGVTHTRVKEGTAKGHSYTEKVEAPTCTEKGYTLHTCTCGDSYKDKYVNELGHNYQYVIDVAAMCGGNSGIRHGECSRCHDKLESSVYKITAHSGTTVIKTVASSYEDVGYTLKKCDVCGREYRDNIVAKKIDTTTWPMSTHGDAIIARSPNSAEKPWLFYNGDMSWYQGGSYNDSGIQSNYNNIKPLLEYCEEKGIKLVIASWPNKSTIYSEYMPTVSGATPGSKMKGYVDGINAIDPRVHAVFPVEELKAYNSYFQTYFKYDTHWNMAGAYIGVQSIYKAIGMETTDLRLIPVTAVSPSLSTDSTKVHNGNNLDLINMAGYGSSRSQFNDDLCYDITYRPEVTYREYSYNADMTVKTENPAMFIGSETTKTFSDNAANGKIVFVGDSFRNYVRPFLAKDFKETTVLHYEHLSEVENELKALGKGDVLVISRVERAGAMHDQLAEKIYNIVTN